MDMDADVLASLVSKVLGYLIIVGSLALKLPQIIAIIRSGSTDGLAISMFILETIAFSISLAYQNRMGYPFFTYGESIFILVQLYVLLYLVLSNRNQLFKPVSLAAISIYFAAFSLSLAGVVPLAVLAFLQSINVLFGIASRLPQIMQNHQHKSTGQLSGLMIFLNFGGALARVLTTLQDVGDMIVLMGYVTSAFLNFVVLAQIVMYRNNTTAVKKIKKEL